MRPNHLWTLLVGPLLFTAFAQQAGAYHLHDHVSITKEALKEFNNCYPQVVLSDEPFFLLASNLEEDLNVVRKDLFYSHYYNPTKTLPGPRFDSSVRIQDLSGALKSESNSILNFVHLGHALHHIQDMSVPVHVIPVEHGPTDTFETYQLQKLTYASGLTCQQLESLANGHADLSELLKSAANDTLKAVSLIRVPLTKVTASGSVTYPVDGSSFWQMSAGNDFGVYKALGQHFGETEIQFADGKGLMPADFYDTFKNQQMRMGVINSWIVLYQFHRPKNHLELRKLSANDVNPLSLLQMENFQSFAQIFAF